MEGVVPSLEASCDGVVVWALFVDTIDSDDTQLERHTVNTCT